MSETEIKLDDEFYDDIYLYSSSVASGGYDIPFVNLGAKYKKNFFKYNYGKLPAKITGSYYANKLQLRDNTSHDFNNTVDYVFSSLQSKEKIPQNFKIGDTEFPVNEAIPGTEKLAYNETGKTLDNLYNNDENNPSCCNSYDLNKTSSIPLDYFSPLYGFVDYDENTNKITRIVITNFAKNQMSDDGSGNLVNYSDISRIQLELMKKNIKNLKTNMFFQEDELKIKQLNFYERCKIIKYINNKKYKDIWYKEFNDSDFQPECSDLNQQAAQDNANAIIRYVAIGCLILFLCCCSSCYYIYNR